VLKKVRASLRRLLRRLRSKRKPPTPSEAVRAQRALRQGQWTTPTLEVVLSDYRATILERAFSDPQRHERYRGMLDGATELLQVIQDARETR
jgi:hypothetical protein